MHTHRRDNSCIYRKIVLNLMALMESKNVEYSSSPQLFSKRLMWWGYFYVFQSGNRFGIDEKGVVNLYTINVPAKFDRKTPSPSYVVRWDCSKWLPQLSQAGGVEPLTQMAVRYSRAFYCVHHSCKQLTSKMHGM